MALVQQMIVATFICSFIHSYPTLLSADFGELDRTLTFKTVGRQNTGNTAKWNARSEAWCKAAAWWLRAGVRGDRLHWLDIFSSLPSQEPPFQFLPPP